MLFQELNFFIQGWRGFLVGQTRGWHAHHRSEAQGSRGGWILPRETLQTAQLRRASALTVELLSRGGRLWGFGFGGGGEATPGLTWWARTTPGILSNSFFARARRIPSVRQLRRLILLRRRRRKVRPRIKRRSRRVGIQRRKGLLGLFLSRASLLRRITRFSYLAYHLRRGIKAQLFGTRFPDLMGKASFVRLGFHPRRGWPRFVQKSRRGGYRVWSSRKIVQNLSQNIVQAQRRRTTREGIFLQRVRITPGAALKKVSPRESISVFSPRWYRGHLRGGRRRQPRLRFRPRWGTLPPGLPTGVLLGGSAGQTLHREVTRGGTPLILVGGIEIVPEVGSLYPVWWNINSLQGPRYLWSHLEGLSHRGGLFRLLWNRLTCLAEW